MRAHPARSYHGGVVGSSHLGCGGGGIGGGNGGSVCTWGCGHSGGFASQLVDGVAWRHYDLTNANFNTTDVEDSANVVELPYGFGVAGYWRNLVADVRGDFRWAWGDRIVAFGDEDQYRWNVMGNIGYAFR